MSGLVKQKGQPHISKLLHLMPTVSNPDTHCTSCGEVLSIYSHYWKCHWSPMVDLARV
jgi:hypothetical protein